MVSCSGSLFQSCCREGRGAADRYCWPVWGALTVFRPHWVCPPLTGVCAFPVFTAQAPGCSIWSGPALHAVPVFGYSTNGRTRLHLLSAGFVPSLAEAAQATRSLMGGLSPVRCAFSPPRPQPQFPSAPVGCMRIVFSRDPPGGCQSSRISEVFG